MAISKDNQQVTLILDKETVAKVDEVCKLQARPSRSNTMAYLIKLALERMEKSSLVLDQE